MWICYFLCIYVCVAGCHIFFSSFECFLLISEQYTPVCRTIWPQYSTSDETTSVSCTLKCFYGSGTLSSLGLWLLSYNLILFHRRWVSNRWFSSLVRYCLYKSRQQKIHQKLTESPCNPWQWHMKVMHSEWCQVYTDMEEGVLDMCTLMLSWIDGSVMQHCSSLIHSPTCVVVTWIHEVFLLFSHSFYVNVYEGMCVCQENSLRQWNLRKWVKK